MTHKGVSDLYCMFFTLSRSFPLRTEASAKVSDIKPVPTLPAAVLQLFDALRAQMPAALLFLKSVTRVSVYRRTAAAGGAAPPQQQQPPQLVFRCSVGADGGGSGQTRELALQVLFVGSKDSMT
jgi:hypothetical protein